jgi:PRC-barrel domain
MAALMRGQGAKISSIAFPHVGWCVVPTRKPLFPKEETMAEASGAMTGKPLIESDTVEGTTVYDPAGNNIGSIKRLMIEKISGRVADAVMSFGGFLGMGTEEHAVPWSKLTYDTNLGGYRTDLTE